MLLFQKKFSTLNIDETLLYLNKTDTNKVQQYFGNSLSGNELGSIFPVSEDESWFDAENEGRPVEEHLYVKGWHTEPYYDETTRTLIWALQAEDYQGYSIINYNVRILTRQGYVSILLVTDEQNLDHDVQIVNQLILPNYTINSGFKYEDYDASIDKKSEYGLTGLILGGVGLAAAKKVGLIALYCKSHQRNLMALAFVCK